MNAPTPEAVGQSGKIIIFSWCAAKRIIACEMPKSRSAMHLDTVFGFVILDVVTSYLEVASIIKCYSLRPGDKAGTLDIREEKKILFEITAECLGIKTQYMISNKLVIVMKGGTMG